MNLSVIRNTQLMSGITQRYVFKDEEFILSKVSYPEKIKEVGALRIQAWKEEQGISKAFFANETWIDELDENAHHWIISTSGHVVASARMSFHETYATVPHAELFDEKDLGKYNCGPFASLNRLVVDPLYRGKGFSSVLDEIRIEYARTNGIRNIIAQPIENRIKPLEEMGFILFGKIRPLPQMPDRQLYFMINEIAENKNVEN